MLVADPSQWETRFAGLLSGTLTIRERMALPGKRTRLVWVTGDATLERIATVDWTHKKAAMGDVRQYMQPVREAIGSDEGEECIIAVAELLNLVAYAAFGGSSGDWLGALVMYTGDNMNVHTWLESRRCGNRYAAFLLTLMCALEGTYGFQVASAYFRTYHNVTADGLTRKLKEETQGMLSSMGLLEVDLREAWEDHAARGWARRAFVWTNQDDGARQVALQLAEKRAQRGVPRHLDKAPAGAGITLVEWMGHAGAPREGSGASGGQSLDAGGATWAIPGVLLLARRGRPVGFTGGGGRRGDGDPDRRRGRGGQPLGQACAPNRGASGRGRRAKER